MDEHASTDHQTSYADFDKNYKPVTMRSIEAAKRAQARERAAFTKSTGLRLAWDGTIIPHTSATNERRRNVR